MLNFKRMACMLLTMGIFITAFPDQALASSDYQYITNISLKVEVDLDAGDEINSGFPSWTAPAESRTFRDGRRRDPVQRSSSTDPSRCPA